MRTVAMIVGQAVLLGALAVTVGLGPAGWVAGAGVVLVLVVLLRGVRLGPADAVTLVRALLVGGVTALVVDGLGHPGPTVALTVVASVALALDAVDGPVARRTGTASAFGARFDMETDAFLILVLSVQVATQLGGWVLAIGAMRYAFATAGALVAWLGATVPPTRGAKTVAAAQGIVLVAAASGVLPQMVAVVAVAAALAALVWSFGRDVRWLVAHRPASAGTAAAPRRRSGVSRPAASGSPGPAGTPPR